MDTKQKKTAPAQRRRSPARSAVQTRKKTAASPGHRAAAVTETRSAPARRRPPVKRSALTKHTAEARRYTAPAPEVVYTPAKPFNRNRLLLQLATVVAVVLALSFGISIFFKVDTINVSGAVKYSPWTIKEASGIEIGDNLLAFGEPKASGKIMAALPYVEKVQIGIKLPGTVNIYIQELEVAYAIKDSADQWWLITAQGKVVDDVDSATAGDYTKILGVQIASPVAGQQAVGFEPPPDPTQETDGLTIPVTVRASDRLDTALSILQYMEGYGIIGEAANVNVADLGSLELWYGQQYQVKLGDTTQLAYKIKCMNGAIRGDNGLQEYDSGILDISFTIKENQVIYAPFE